MSYSDAKINHLRTLKQVKIFGNAGLKERICGLRITYPSLIPGSAIYLLCNLKFIFSYVKQNSHHLPQQGMKELIKYTKHLA